MPGVPPNALGKLKGMLKGMLGGGSNKRKKQEQEQKRKPAATATTTTSTVTPSTAAAAAAPVVAASNQHKPVADTADLKAESAPEAVVAGGPEGRKIAKEEELRSSAQASATPTAAVPTGVTQHPDAGLSQTAEPGFKAPLTAAEDEKILAEPTRVDGAAADATGSSAGRKA